MNRNNDFEDISSSSAKPSGRKKDDDYLASPFVSDESRHIDEAKSSRTGKRNGDGFGETVGFEPKQSAKRQLHDDYYEFGGTDGSDDIYSSTAYQSIEDEDMPQRNQTSSRSLNSYASRGAYKKLKTRLAVFNVVISVVLALSIICTAVMGVLAHYTGGGNYVEISSNYSDLGIDQTIVDALPKGITNVALFGLDSRSKVTNDKSKALSGLSDAIIILSVNTNDNTVKMTSILRDSFVPIDGTKRKINEAYSRGGAQLAIKTLNQNFGLNINNYVAVNLHQLWKVIDFMGGIDIQITEAERKELNYLANSEGFGIEKLDHAGAVHLNGGQAMTYSRIRHTDSDNIRAMRQQKVLTCLFEKAKKMSMSEYPGLLKSIMDNVETSLDYSEIMAFAPLLSGGKLTISSTSVPGNEVVARGGIFEDSRGGWVWKYDIGQAKDYIHKWIYGE